MDITEPEEGLEQEEIPEDSPLKKALKKIYISVIALFLVSLLVMNTGAGNHIISYLSGKVVTSRLQEGNMFELKNNGSVVFDEIAFLTLQELYKNIQKTEFKVCLTGYKKEKDYFVEGLYIPKTYDKQVYSVTAALCDNSTIISLHTHPYLHCIFSDQDIENLAAYRQSNPDVILGLMCDRDKITFYGY